MTRGTWLRWLEQVETGYFDATGDLCPATTTDLMRRFDAKQEPAEVVKALLPAPASRGGSDAEGRN